MVLTIKYHILVKNTNELEIINTFKESLMDVQDRLSDAVTHLGNDETTKFRDIVYDVLAFKANERIDSEKHRIASTLFSSEEESSNEEI